MQFFLDQWKSIFLTLSKDMILSIRFELIETIFFFIFDLSETVCVSFDVLIQKVMSQKSVDSSR